MLAERVSAIPKDWFYSDKVESSLDFTIGRDLRRKFQDETYAAGSDRKRAAEIMRQLADELEART